MQNKLSTKVHVAVVILMDGSHHEIDRPTYTRLMAAQKDEFIQPDAEKLTMFRVSSITELLTMSDYREKFPQRFTNFGQPVYPLPVFPEDQYSKKNLAQVMEEFIATHPNNEKVKKFYNSFKKWKSANPTGKDHYEPKYKTWEDLKKAEALQTNKQQT